MRQVARGNYDYVFDALSWRLPRTLFTYCHALLYHKAHPDWARVEQETYFARLATERDAALLAQIGVREELVRARLARGDCCAIAGRDDELLAAVWGATGKRFQIVSGAPLDTGERGFLVYGAFTREDQRRRGLNRIVRGLLCQQYLAAGRPELFETVNRLNAGPRQLHATQGSTVIGETIYVIVLGLHLCYYVRWPVETKRLRVFLRCPPGDLPWV